MRKKLAIMLLILFPALVCSETITLLAEDGWPPFSRADGTGLSNEAVVKAFKLSGVDVKVKVYPYGRLLSILENGDGLMGINVGKTSEMMDKFLFPKKPLFLAQGYFYTLAEKPLLVRYYEEIPPSTRVGLIIGYNYGDYIDRNIGNLQLERVKSHAQNIGKLKNRRIDAIYEYESVMNELFKEFNLGGVLVKSTPGSTIEWHLAFSKKHKDSEKYIKLFEKGFDKLMMSSEYNVIYSKAEGVILNE